MKKDLNEMDVAHYLLMQQFLGSDVFPSDIHWSEILYIPWSPLYGPRPTRRRKGCEKDKNKTENIHEWDLLVVTSVLGNKYQLTGV
jgi:hypothetical protein